MLFYMFYMFYRAWRETRARFLLSAAALAWFSGAFLFFRLRIPEAAGRPYASFVAGIIFDGAIRNLFVIFVLVLGLGGLLQERARGTAAFTLSFPVSRARLIAVRGAAGLMGVAILSALPPLIVVTVAPLVHETYPPAAAVRFAAQWTACGAVLFAAAFLASVVISHEYSALATSVVLLVAYSLLLRLPAVQRFPSLNLFEVMAGTDVRPLTLIPIVLVAVTLLVVAGLVTERQDF